MSLLLDLWRGLRPLSEVEHVSVARKPRKVVQITDREGTTCALCDDGSMWVISEFNPSWTRMKDIPSEGDE